MTEIIEEVIQLTDQNEAQILFGVHDKNLKLVRQSFKVDVFLRGGQLRVRGERKEVEAAYQAVKHLLAKIKKTGSLPQRDVDEILASQLRSRHGEAPAVNGEANPLEGLPSFDRGLRARTAGQNEYVKAIESTDMVFCLGPAGTGKTYIAIGMAADALKAGKIKRILLVRPAVEAGEKLGFLPGDFQAKVSPYLSPLFDALQDFMDGKQIERLVERGVIEIAPLAYMRGRTLSSSFIILDEAQNTTKRQMKMFLTRLGNNSKIVVTGDPTQIDLPNELDSGLIHAEKILRTIKGLKFVNLTKSDIVRHPLVQEVLSAYEVDEQKGKLFSTRGEEYAGGAANETQK